MEVMKCPSCGGRLEINDINNPVVCGYCDNTVTITKNFSQLQNKLDRATTLRMSNNFDASKEIYEDILKDHPTDSVAAWGLVLSKYGVEYVKDPRTNQYIPTIHRLNYSSILEDIDYKTAIQYSDTYDREAYIKQAKVIYDVQKEALELVNKQEKFDVFISYKESDENDNRTKDSYEAADIYTRIIQNHKNLKVFFSRNTLQNMAGQKYEPVIFSALNSSKVMILVGLKPEHFSAPWVRNEWTRFLDMSRRSKNDEKKIFIVVGPDMSLNELPYELQSIQAFHMKDSHWSANLFKNLDGIFSEQKNAAVENPYQAFSQVNQEQTLLTRATDFLTIRDYINSLAIFQELTSKYPLNYLGWWGVIQSKTKNFDSQMVDTINGSQLYSLIKDFDKVKAINESRPFKEFDEFKGKLLEFIDRVSESLADKNVNNAEKIKNQIVSNFDDEKVQLNAKNDELERQRQRTSTELETTTKTLESLSHERNELIAKVNAQDNFNRISTALTWLGHFMLYLPIFLLLTSGILTAELNAFFYLIALFGGKYFLYRKLWLSVVIFIFFMRESLNNVPGGLESTIILLFILSRVAYFIAKKIKKSEYSIDEIDDYDSNIANSENQINQFRDNLSNIDSKVTNNENDVQEKEQVITRDVSELEYYIKSDRSEIKKYEFSKYAKHLGQEIVPNEYVVGINSKYKLSE